MDWASRYRRSFIAQIQVPPTPTPTISEKLGNKMTSVKRLDLTAAPKDPNPTLAAVAYPVISAPSLWSP